MIAHTYYPTAPLAGFVDLMWLYEDYRVPHAQERLLPTGTTSLVVNLARREATLCGAHSAPFFLDTARMVAHLGVHFRPGGAFPFLGLPVHTLHNQVIDLDTLWGSTTYGLRDRLLAAPTPQAKFSVMEQTLLAHLDRLRARHPAVTFALQAIAQGPSHTPLTVITDQIGLSPRRFRQLFQETVGLTPKRFWRVQRFQQIIQQVEEAATVDWVDLALATGYFDQAHLIHDFQNLSGLTPSAYLAQRSDHRNHVPVVT
jgi:AraC-like DNA-binding protein